MKAAGTVSIIFSCVLFGVALITGGGSLWTASDNLNRSDAQTQAIIDGSEVVSPRSDSSSFAWVAGEVVVGVAFLIPGIAMVKHKPS